MKIFVPATSANLGPGFDALGLCISLFNNASIKKSKKFNFSFSGEGEGFIDRKKNIIIEAFKKTTLDLIGEKLVDVDIDIENKIPISKGLGSSSASIVLGIALAYKHLGIEIDKAQVLNQALTYEDHPDNIAPAIYGGFCSSIIKDSKVQTIKANIDTKLKALILTPPFSVSTKKSRTKLPKKVPLKDAVFNLSHASFLTAVFFTQQYDLLRDASLDMLHQTNRMHNISVLFDVQKIALLHGALSCTLSGSGPSMLSICYQEDIQNLRSKLQQKFPNFDIRACSFDNHGLIIK